MKVSQHYITSLILYTLLATASQAVFAEQDSIVLNSDGDYVITYKSYLGWQKITYIPSTKINPDIKGAVKVSGPNSDQFNYRYAIHNSQESRQYIVGLRLSASNVLSSNPMKPTGWTGDIVFDRVAGSGFIVGWSYWRGEGIWESGLKPGRAVNGFGFESTDLPGAGEVAIWGARASGHSFPDEGPSDDDNPTIIKEFDRIIDHDFITRITVVPRIKVPYPLDATTVLNGIKNHLDGDLRKLDLVDAGLLTDLDRWLETAISASKIGNIKSLKASIDAARKLLRLEYSDLDNDDEVNEPTKQQPTRIHSVAARALNLDLKYVYKRVNEYQ